MYTADKIKIQSGPKALINQYIGIYKKLKTFKST